MKPERENEAAKPANVPVFFENVSKMSSGNCLLLLQGGVFGGPMAR
jgi:hypothetical protein